VPLCVKDRLLHEKLRRRDKGRERVVNRGRLWTYSPGGGAGRVWKDKGARRTREAPVSSWAPGGLRVSSSRAPGDLEPSW
jgi:hypothetical protein